jgi:cytochrome c
MIKFYILLISLFLTLTAQAADLNRGTKIFQEECAECHSVKEGKNKKGPSLWLIGSRKAASIADFNYSDSMKESGITWTAEKIDAYISHPKQVVPAGKMKYDGLESNVDRADVIAYLMTLH